MGAYYDDKCAELGVEASLHNGKVPKSNRKKIFAVWKADRPNAHYQEHTVEQLTEMVSRSRARARARAKNTEKKRRHRAKEHVREKNRKKSAAKQAAKSTASLELRVARARSTVSPRVDEVPLPVPPAAGVAALERWKVLTSERAMTEFACFCCGRMCLRKDMSHNGAEESEVPLEEREVRHFTVRAPPIPFPTLRYLSFSHSPIPTEQMKELVDHLAANGTKVLACKEEPAWNGVDVRELLAVPPVAGDVVWLQAECVSSGRGGSRRPPKPENERSRWIVQGLPSSAPSSLGVHSLREFTIVNAADSSQKKNCYRGEIRVRIPEPRALRFEGTYRAHVEKVLETLEQSDDESKKELHASMVWSTVGDDVAATSEDNFLLVFATVEFAEQFAAAAKKECQDLKVEYVSNLDGSGLVEKLDCGPWDSFCGFQGEALAIECEDGADRTSADETLYMLWTDKRFTMCRKCSSVLSLEVDGSSSSPSLPQNAIANGMNLGWQHLEQIAVLRRVRHVRCDTLFPKTSLVENLGIATVRVRGGAVIKVMPEGRARDGRPIFNRGISGNILSLLQESAVSAENGKLLEAAGYTDYVQVIFVMAEDDAKRVREKLRRREATGLGMLRFDRKVMQRAGKFYHVWGLRESITVEEWKRWCASFPDHDIPESLLKNAVVISNSASAAALQPQTAYSVTSGSALDAAATEQAESDALAPLKCGETVVVKADQRLVTITGEPRGGVVTVTFADGKHREMAVDEVARDSDTLAAVDVSGAVEAKNGSGPADEDALLRYALKRSADARPPPSDADARVVIYTPPLLRLRRRHVIMIGTSRCARTGRLDGGRYQQRRR